MKPNAEDIVKFCHTWRARLLERRRERAEMLSEEEFGQLVTINTIIAYATDERSKGDG
jgi:hypothetical protein